jgi:hypothetical protein
MLTMIGTVTFGETGGEKHVTGSMAFKGTQNALDATLTGEKVEGSAP